ncbi:MAG: dihydrolipoyl dehydrogenase [Candidatus Latescibacter sp.]|nr:dihydrolipoyl dehydrogenase [Candidatus Latescibacter sp.]
MRTNVVIIGAGPGGYIAAIRAAQLGAAVTIVDRDNVGGTCLNRGCIPTKVMKATAELFHTMSRAADFGITVEGKIHVDMGSVLARKETVVRNLVNGVSGLFERYGIRYLHGAGRIEKNRKVVVLDPGGKPTELDWDRLILAMGTVPQALPSLPFDRQWILSTDEGVNLREIPESALIVGGGVNGCEFASILAALGTKVTLVEALSRLLPVQSIDEDTSSILEREMKKQKITVILNRMVEKAALYNGKVQVTLGPSRSPLASSPKDREPLTFTVDKALVTVGRHPLTSDMGLENLDVRTDSRGWIPVNERMETNIPGVYAIGDVRGPSKPMLAHVASAEGLAAAENALGGDKIMDYRVVPSAIFTTPEAASVGLAEKEALEQGYKTLAETFLFRTLGKAQTIGEIAGQVKIVFEDSGKILGVHAVGPHVTDLIAEGALALSLNATVKDLASTIHAHPTLSEAFMEAAHSAIGVPLHKPPR